MIRIFFVCIMVGSPAVADSVLAAANIRSGTVLTANDVVASSIALPGAADDVGAVVGLEARVNLYANRPIRMQDLGPPTLVDRNEIISLIYESPTLRIVAEGRALGRAGAGETVRVMNMASRSTVIGVVANDGTVRVR